MARLSRVAEYEICNGCSIRQIAHAGMACNTENFHKKYARNTT